jgi:regulatory protein
MARKPVKTLDAQGLLSYAARVLSARAQTVSELREKLRRKASQVEDVDAVITRLREGGYLNDARFADSFAGWRRDNEGFGQARVVRDLMARRVAPELAKKAVESAFKESDETEMIEKYLARKYRGKDLPVLLSEEKHLASAYRRLRTAGFSTSNSIRVLKKFAAQAERLEEMEESE